jgi:hypothetical protein
MTVVLDPANPAAAVNDPALSGLVARGDSRGIQESGVSAYGPIPKFYFQGLTPVTTPGNILSWHGSLNRSDSYVPFIVSYPGGNTEPLRSLVTPVCGTDTSCDSTLRVAPLVAQVLSTQIH